MKDLDPTWTKIFFLDFSPNEVTNIEVKIYDYVGDGKEPTYMGEANFEAASVFQSPGKFQSEQVGRAESSRYVTVVMGIPPPLPGLAGYRHGLYSSSTVGFYRRCL